MDPVMIIDAQAVAESARAAVLDGVTRDPWLRLATEADAGAIVEIRLLTPVDPPSDPAVKALAGDRPVVVPTWFAHRGGEQIVRPREVGALPQLLADLSAVARWEAAAQLSPPPSAALPTVRIVIEDPAGAPIGRDVALEATDDAGDPAAQRVAPRYEFRLVNDGAEAVYVALLELGANRAVTALLPHPQHVDQLRSGCRLEAGASVALAADYYARDGRFAPLIAGGLPARIPAEHPWVVQPNSPPPPCAVTLLALVTRERIDLPLDGPPGALRAALETHDWAVVTRTVRIDPPPPPAIDAPEDDGGRQISPTGSGYVLVYGIEKLNGYQLGTMGVTSTTGMKHLNPYQGYWRWFPKSTQPWPSAFRLVAQSSPIPEAEALSQFTGARRLTNEPFAVKPTKVIAPDDMQQCWKITFKGAELGYLARAGDRLHWYCKDDRAWLPQGTLEFTAASGLPVGDLYHQQVDDPLN